MTRRTGGPARVVGPLAFSLLALLALAAPPVARAIEWIPPRPISAWIPGATIGPGHNATLELVLRGNGSAASITWSVTSGGNFFAGVTPSSGSLVLGANALVRIPLTVSAPPSSLGVATINAVVTYANGGGVAAKATGTIVAGTGGRPEVWPVTPTLSGAAGSSGNVQFQIHSQAGASEELVVVSARSNPDPNNIGALFAGTAPPTSVIVPGGGTVTVNAPTTLSARAPAGSSNAVQISVQSSEGLSSATAFAIVDASLPDSLPTKLLPIGLVPVTEAPAGRDGPAAFPSRNAWLVPCGTEGVRVWRASSTDSIGVTDLNGDGGDDRLVGTIRIPGFAGALAIVPGFVAASGETLDVGLLAAGSLGLLVLDLRVIEDPTFGSWEDFFDTDQNGIDDRILRTVPIAGFATDVAWTRAPSGRVVAFVAGADAGSNPLITTFDPAFTSPGSGAGVVAVDVTTAVDSLSGLPPVVATWPTPGNALDVELRGGGSTATLIVADGAAGVEAADVTLGTSTPANVTIFPRATTALSATWGSPYARDAAWIPNRGDSAYAAIACAAGGTQIVRVPATTFAAPTLVLAQQVGGAPCGVSSAYTGALAVAQNAAGMALLQSPGAAALDLIQTGAGAPYTAPVTLARGAAFPGASALEKGTFQNPGGSATALTFEPTAGPLPDLFVSDDNRVLVLRPGNATITSVAWEENAPPARHMLRLSAAPNPTSGPTQLRLLWLGASSNDAGPLFASPREGDRIDVLDVQGRVVRTIRAAPVPAGTEWRAAWDGRDRAGRPLASGRYWVRLRDRQGRASKATPVLILR